MAKETKQELDQSTGEKIKAAAYKLFTQKGYAATRTRDIAEEAGINLALLNYYFRSKEKLFELIMLENMQQFLFGIVNIANNETTSYSEKISLIVNAYIDMLTEQPDMPIFVLSELRNDSGFLLKRLNMRPDFIINSVLVRQLNHAMEKGEIGKIVPIHLIMNVIGLVIFPFMASPMLKEIGSMTDDDFKQLMNERRKMIPNWIQEMIQKK